MPVKEAAEVNAEGKGEEWEEEWEEEGDGVDRSRLDTSTTVASVRLEG